MRARRRRRLARSLLLSVQLLAAHRLRTALSISGLLIGVAAVMVMSAIGEGAERRVLQRVRALGTDLLIVTPAPARRVAGRQRQVETVTTLHLRDAAAIAQESTFAMAVAPAVYRSMVASAGARNANTGVTGTTVEGLRIRGMVAETGRPFDEDEDRENRRVALLGPAVARSLFADDDPIGRSIRIGATPFDVIGVLRRRGTDVGGTDLDNTVVIPLGTAMRRLLNVSWVDALYVQATGGARLDALEEEVRDILERQTSARAAIARPFVIQNQAVLLRTERGAARALNGLVVGVAALAFLVGAIGIIVVMLISVRERVPEIGLRRALGARRTDIRLQFLMESALLGTAGGVTGVIAGLVTAAGAALLGPWDLVLSWRVAAAALMACGLLGLAVGVMPAARAARLEPIESLRLH
jgi:putative ABC transport system permease protein